MNDVKQKFKSTSEQKGGLENKIDHLLFSIEFNISKLCDKKGKVKYKDIFQEIMDARIYLQFLLKNKL